MLLHMLRAMHPLTLQPLLLLIIHAMMVATAATKLGVGYAFKTVRAGGANVQQHMNAWMAAILHTLLTNVSLQ